MSAEQVPEFVIGSLSPEPGQTVVLTVPKILGAGWAEAVGEQLKRAFPDNRCVLLEDGMSLASVDRDLLSACKQWRHATEQRLRHLNSRNEAVPLTVDAALFEAIDKAEGKS